MSNFSSKTKYVEARPRREKKLGRGGSVVSVAASSGGSGVSKSYVDSNFVTLATEQTIPGPKDFVGGIKVNGMPISYNSELGVWEFTGDLLVTGAVTMFSSLSGFQPSTVTEAVEVDGETIVKTKNSQGQWQLTAIGGGSGSGGGISAAEVNILISNALEPYALATSIPTDNKQLLNGAGYATISDISSALNGLASQSWVGDNYLSKAGGTINGSITAVGNIYLGADGESMLVMNRNYYNRFVAAKAGGRFAWRVNGQIDDVLVLDESGYLRSPIGFVGNLTGNAGSATKLQTPRTIWGQSFDGTDNLGGTLSQVSMIYFTGTNKGLYSGPTFGSHLTKNDIIIYGDVIGLYGDKVAVGATVADAKLHVHGTAILDEHTSIGTRLNIGNSSCMLRILTPRADRFSWVSGRLAEYSDFSIEYNDGSQYGLYGSIDYYTGDFAWQVGRSDGLDILRNLYLQPLGGNVAIGGTTADANLHVHGNLLTTGVITTPQINIGGLAAYKLQDDTLFIDANVVVRGAISMFGVNTLGEMESIEQRLLSLEQKVEQLSA